MGRCGNVPAVDRRAARRQRIRLLRRPTIRERTATPRAPLDRVREGRGAPLPDHAGQEGRATLWLGLSRTSRRDGDRETTGCFGSSSHQRVRHRQVQRGLSNLGTALHRRVGANRHSTSTLGRLRERLQDHGPRLHGVRDLGVQTVVGQRSHLRGKPGHALLMGCRNAAQQLRDSSR